MTSITDLCERLADVYALQGVPVRENLRPGVTRETVLRTLAPHGLQVPDALVDLYTWRNGHLRQGDDERHRYIWFRDDIFMPLEQILEAHEHIQLAYAVEEALLEDVDLKAIIPISENNGAWDAIVCGRHSYGAHRVNPVIHIHQGVDVYYDSIETMLRTNIDWVASPHWDSSSALPTDVEQEIWRRHNPGLPIL